MKTKKTRRVTRTAAERIRDNLPEWPAGKPFPDFKDLAEEEKFYMSWSFAEHMGAGTEDLVYEPRATQKPRQHVYRVRFDDQEMAILQALAKRRGVPEADICIWQLHSSVR